MGCAVHVKQAKRIGVSIKAMRRPSIIDVDSPADLSKYLEQQQAAGANPVTPLFELMQTAQALTEQGFGSRVSYSRKVFIPLTQVVREAITAPCQKPRQFQALFQE